MNVRIETLSADELAERLVLVPEWIRTVLDDARARGRMLEYETLPTTFGTYPIRVRVVAEGQEAQP